MNTRQRTMLLVGVPVVMTAFVGLYAGPLNPPAGPISSTNKTLAEIEPRITVGPATTPGDASSLFRITQPGSYVLVGNITGVAGKNGIVIAAGGVTLDLNGFQLTGVSGSLHGVQVSGGASGIVVRRGSVRDWGGAGLDLQTAGAINSRVEHVIAAGNALHGIMVAAGTAVVACEAGGNEQDGIATQGACRVTDCVARGNLGNGVSTGTGSTVANTVAAFNAAAGISTGPGSTVSNCTASNNTASGVAAGAGGSVIGSTAYANAGHGITAGAGGSVLNCTLRANTLDGVNLAVGCSAVGNACYFNGSGAGSGAGIHATGADTRIEANNCVGADRGIEVDVAGNLILRNSCSGNTTNWIIVANNYYGPIIDRSGVATVGVSGNAAAGTLATTDPNANFTY